MTAGLPTYIGNAPTQAQINALPANTLTLADIQARSFSVPAWAQAGFPASPIGSNVIAFLSNGNSTYHGGSANVTRRFANGFQMTAAYTWSHLIDDTTAEVNSTVLSPRRVQDFQNLRAERADSALDRRHRLVMSWIYELPWFRKSGGLTEALLGGFHIAGTYTYEAGERITIRAATMRIKIRTTPEMATLNWTARKRRQSGDRAMREPAHAFTPTGRPSGCFTYRWLRGE